MPQMTRNGKNLDEDLFSINESNLIEFFRNDVLKNKLLIYFENAQFHFKLE